MCSILCVGQRETTTLKMSYTCNLGLFKISNICILVWQMGWISRITSGATVDLEHKNYILRDRNTILTSEGDVGLSGPRAKCSEEKSKK